MKIDTKGYPSSSLFGTLNSWGALIRHAINVQLNNVRLSRVEPSTAHVMYLGNAQNIIVNNNKIDSADSSIPWMKVSEVDSVKLQLNWPNDTKWLELQGNACKGLNLVTDLDAKELQSKVLGKALGISFSKK